MDPDNRRPVDWALRRRLLASDEAPAKLDLIQRTLALRARRAESFDGGYESVEAGEDVCAFVRGGDVLVAVAVRPSRIPDFGAAWRSVAADRDGLVLFERS